MEEISDTKRDFNIGKMCRTCLLETEDEMHEIFGNSQESDSLSINQVLLQLTGNVQVNSCVYYQFNNRIILENVWRQLYNLPADFTERWTS